MQKRPLSYTLTTPISSLPSPLLGPGACHHPSPVSPHPVTDPSLYSDHNASPPLVRSTDVSARPHARPLPSRPKSGPLFGLAHSHTHAASPGTSAPNTHTHKRANTHADTHKAHSPLERWAEVVTVITDPHSSHPPPTQRVRERQKLRSGIIPNVECVSVHSHPTHGIPGDDGGMKRAQSLHTHTHIHNTLLMHPAPALGLKALHDLLNKRLEQQVKGGTVRSVTNVVLYVHTDV